MKSGLVILSGYAAFMLFCWCQPEQEDTTRGGGIPQNVALCMRISPLQHILPHPILSFILANSVVICYTYLRYDKSTPSPPWRLP